MPQHQGLPQAQIQFHFLTLFTDLIRAGVSTSILARASEKGLVAYDPVQIRDFATDKHRTVDDTPYGGGAGMLLRADVLHSAWKSIPKRPRTLTVLLSPQGQVLNQAMARELRENFEQIILVCGHYEGVDERFIELCVDREISVGDYVLTGGELPALLIADAVTRLVPGVLGNEDSFKTDSLEQNLLKYPQYTRPRDYEGHLVPEVLLSGDHGAIEKWRRQQMIVRTQKKRPDLLKAK